jgi:hypothetical protein
MPLSIPLRISNASARLVRLLDKAAAKKFNAAAPQHATHRHIQAIFITH